LQLLRLAKRCHVEGIWNFVGPRFSPNANDLIDAAAELLMLSLPHLHHHNGERVSRL